MCTKNQRIKGSEKSQDKDLKQNNTATTSACIFLLSYSNKNVRGKKPTKGLAGLEEDKHVRIGCVTQGRSTGAQDQPPHL